MKHLKSVVAIAIAFSLGFISCKNDDPIPEPQPQPESADFEIQNKWSLSDEILAICDVELEYTDIDGKVTTANIKDCPTETVDSTGVKFNMHVFNKVEKFTITSIDKLPLQTSLKVKFTSKGIIPSAPFNALVFPDCFTKYKSTAMDHPVESIYYWPTFYRNKTIDSAEKLDEFVNLLNKAYGKVVMNVDKKGVITISIF